MYSIVNSTLALFYKQYRQIVEITMNRTDGTERLTEADIIQGGMTIDRYCISGDKIEIGSAIAAELTLKLDNREGKFDDTNFEGAELFVRIGIKKWDAGRWEKAKVEYVPVGYFTVDESPKKALSITLSALDRMVQFDKDFDADGITFPTTVGNLLTYCCTKCGVPLHTIPETLPNYSYQVKECPQRENLTYRQIIQWIGEITATCGYIDWDGKLRMEWYSDTDTVIDKSLRYTSDMNEKDVTITGVQVEDDEENIYLAGTDEYALNIEGNALIQYDHNVIAHAVYERVNGFTYRPYTCTTKSLPHLYPMDKIAYVDKNGVSHNSIVTHWVYKLNGRTQLTAKGVTATKENYAKANPLTSREAAVLAKMKKANEIELDSRQQAVLALNETIVNSLGLFMSTAEERNGSIVYYYHNAATLEDSSVIYTFREGGFAWTDDWNDGDPVWQYGMTKDGNAVLNILSVYKIQAKHIEVGAITADKIKVGAIGGFIIDETHIGIGKNKYDDLTNGVYISTDGIGLGAGKFYVTNEGFLHADNGEFTGKIHATEGKLENLLLSGELYFGGNKNYFINANYDDNSYYVKLPGFQVNEADGAVFKSGKIGGWIINSNWMKSDGTDSGVYCGMYSGDYQTDAYYTTNKPSLVKPGTYSNGRFYAGASSSENIASSKFAVLDDGSLYAEYAQITGTITAKSGNFANCTIDDTCIWKGSNSTTKIQSHGLTIYSNEMNSVGVNYQIGSGGSFIYTGDTSLAIPYPIVFGTSTKGVGTDTTYANINGLYIGTDGSVSLHTNSPGSSGLGSVAGITIMSDESDILLAAKSDMSLITEGTGKLIGTWKLGSDAPITSDRNLKHDIVVLDECYSNLFDALKPMKFKYNYGNSNRYHTGFIAQDVYEATMNAGLSTSDFAAYVEFTDKDGNVECGLRYGEFISLNTWQIQKLKTRVAKLERQVAKLSE